MLKPTTPHLDPQRHLFGDDLLFQLDPNDPLLQLSRVIPWQDFDEAFKHHYSEDNGSPAIPIRVMVGLLLLKSLENLSDERVVLEWKRNPYYQAFCGVNKFQRSEPCHETELSHFRKRIGKSGVKQIFQMTVSLHGGKVEESEVNIDSTVQEKAITYPTDGKLAIKIINRLNKLAKTEGINQRRTYIKEVKQRRIELRNFRHPRRSKQARKALKRLRTIARTLLRELRRKLPKEFSQGIEGDFTFYERVLNQQPKDKNKIYSLHEPHVYCIAKGKEHKRYEYGTKATVTSTAKGGIILSVVAHSKNKHDSHCLEEAIGLAMEVRKTRMKMAVCDRGYKGKKKINDVEIILPGGPCKKDNRYQKDKKRKRCRQRAAIEPLIGHLKSDFRLSRNFLKGMIGDEINLLMSASAWNLRKWILLFYCALKKYLFVCWYQIMSQYGLERSFEYKLSQSMRQALNTA